MIRTSRKTGTRERTPLLGQAAAFALPGVWSAAVLGLQLLVPAGVDVLPLLVATPAIVCAVGGRRRHVVLGGLGTLPALIPHSGDGGSLGARAGTLLAVLVVTVMGCLISGRRHRLLRELERIRHIAVAAQQTLLRPLPRTVGGLTVAGDCLSASRGAQVGGDLYEVLGTPHGVRAVLGDVRGHGVSAIGTVAALLGSFREAAHDEPDLAGVLRRMDRALHRHLQGRGQGECGAVPVEEEFVTVLLVQVRADGCLTLLNCGHPWPYRITVGPGADAWATPIAGGDPLPPLGLLGPSACESPPVHRSRLLPGQALFAHTDGAEDARDPSGAFFPLGEALDRAARAAVRGGSLSPAALAETFRALLLRHARGRLADDVATLTLYRERPRIPAASCPPPAAEPDRVPHA